MTIQTDFSTTFYVALGDFNGTLSPLGDLHMNLSDAASEYSDAMTKGMIERGYVIEVQTGKDVTEAARTAAYGWITQRMGDVPVWLAAE